MSNYTVRSSGIINPSEFSPVNIIGCGSIGSYTALNLVKMGVSEFNLYDHDNVEDVNIGTQAFSSAHISLPKVEALKKIIEENSINPIVNTFQEKVSRDTQIPRNITIVGVDSMYARKEIFEAIKFSVPLFIDGRIGGETIRVFSVENSGESVKKYKGSLYSDEEAVDLPCTETNVADIGFIIGAFIARNVRYFVKKREVINEITFDTITMALIHERS